LGHPTSLINTFAETKALALFDKLSKGCQQLVDNLLTELSTACLNPFLSAQPILGFLLFINTDS